MDRPISIHDVQTLKNEDSGQNLNLIDFDLINWLFKSKWTIPSHPLFVPSQKIYAAIIPLTGSFFVSSFTIHVVG